jgi:hypothetical protein
MSIVITAGHRTEQHTGTCLSAGMDRVQEFDVIAGPGRAGQPSSDVGETRGHEVPPTIGGRRIPGSAADGA